PIPLRLPSVCAAVGNKREMGRLDADNASSGSAIMSTTTGLLNSGAIGESPMILPHRMILVASLAVTLPFFPASRTLAQDSDPLVAARASVLACEANLASFKTYRCKYSITFGRANSLEKALKADFFESQKCDYYLAVDGDRAKLECLYELPKFKKEDLKP